MDRMYLAPVRYQVYGTSKVPTHLQEPVGSFRAVPINAHGMEYVRHNNVIRPVYLDATGTSCVFLDKPRGEPKQPTQQGSRT